MSTQLWIGLVYGAVMVIGQVVTFLWINFRGGFGNDNPWDFLVWWCIWPVAALIASVICFGDGLQRLGRKIGVARDG